MGRGSEERKEEEEEEEKEKEQEGGGRGGGGGKGNPLFFNCMIFKMLSKHIDKGNISGKLVRLIYCGIMLPTEG